MTRCFRDRLMARLPHLTVNLPPLRIKPAHRYTEVTTFWLIAFANQFSSKPSPTVYYGSKEQKKKPPMDRLWVWFFTTFNFLLRNDQLHSSFNRMLHDGSESGMIQIYQAEAKTKYCDEIINFLTACHFAHFIQLCLKVHPFIHFWYKLIPDLRVTGGLYLSCRRVSESRVTPETKWNFFSFSFF